MSDDYKYTLFRWIVIHVIVGLLPVAAAVFVPFFFGDASSRFKLGTPGAGEILFFSIMISSIAFGDALELPTDNKGKRFALGILGIGLAWVLLLYGANVHQHTSQANMKLESYILWASIIQALLFIIVGTLVQLACRHVEENRGRMMAVNN